MLRLSVAQNLHSREVIIVVTESPHTLGMALFSPAAPRGWQASSMERSDHHTKHSYQVVAGQMDRVRLLGIYLNGKQVLS